MKQVIKRKRILSFLLVAAMLFTSLNIPQNAQAANNSTNLESAQADSIEQSEEISVSIGDTAVSVGKPITATAQNYPEGSVLEYEWKVGDTVKAVGKDVSSYTPVEEDFEKWIQVTVRCEGCEDQSSRIYFSNLPVVYLDFDLDAVIADKGTYVDGTMNLQGNGEFTSGKQLYDGKLQVKGRGNSTWHQVKKPFKLKLDSKTDILGMGKNKHWVLLANYTDGSLMRNELSYKLAGQWGLTYQDGEWVDLIINGEYYGNYYLGEHVRIGSTRVDIEDLADNAADAAGAVAAAGVIADEDGLAAAMEEDLSWISTDSFTYENKTFKVSDYYTYDKDALLSGGLLFELDEYYDEISKFRSSLDQPIMFNSPEFAKTNPEMVEYAKNFINSFEAAIQSPDFHAEYKGEEVSAYDMFDMDALLKYWMIQELFVNVDGMKKSNYFHKAQDTADGISKMYMGPVWDMDWGAGGEGDSPYNVWQTLHYTYNAQGKQWYRYLCQDPYFLSRACEFYWEHRDEIKDMIESIHNEVGTDIFKGDAYNYLYPSAMANQERWGAYKQGYKGEVDKLYNWLNNRVAWLDKKMASVNAMGLYNADDKIDLTVKDGKVSINAQGAKAEVIVNGKVEGMTALENGTGTFDVSGVLTEAKDVIHVVVYDANGNSTGSNFGYDEEITGIEGENILVNPDFDQDGTGWYFSSGAGIGSNNGYPKGTKHFYLDGKADLSTYLKQTVKVPADGTYKASFWVASNGTGGKFGIRTVDGQVLKEAAIAKNTTYTEYTLEDIVLTGGTKVELYVSGATGWVNGDAFEFVCIHQTGDIEEETPSYIFEGNMVMNPSFSDSDGWQFKDAGYAQNNGHHGNGDRHFYINKSSGTMKQVIEVPYTGYYKTGLWVASAGANAVFGVKNQTTGEEQKCTLATNTKYSEYELEIWLNKGDKAEIYVTGGSQWVNGDDVSLEYNSSRFVNMVVNPEFKKDTAWVKNGKAAIENGKAVLGKADDAVSQKIYIPQNGPYYAEVTLENASGAVVTFAGKSSQAVNGNQTVKVSVADLKCPGPVEVKIAGKADVAKVEVMFDLEEMPNEAPTADNVVVEGDCTIDLVLEAFYEFVDADGHAEGNSVYQWMLADKEDGKYTAIEGETKKNIVVKPEWQDKYLKFQVTPVDQYAKAGKAVESKAVGPVDLNLIQNPGFESNGANWSGVSISNKDAYAGLNRAVVNVGAAASQTITVPESAYYDLSAVVRYAGSKEGAIEIQNESGNVLFSMAVPGAAGWEFIEKKHIPLEAGQVIKLVLKGASDKAYDADSLSLKRDREAGIPVFKNVKQFVTNPEANRIVIDIENQNITLSYVYGTDLSAIKVEEILVSEGSEATLKKGDVLDLTKDVTFKVTGKDGKADEWTLHAVMGEKKVALESSNKILADTFNWAASKVDQFVMTGLTGPINVSNNNYDGAEQAKYIPSYWAGYYDRTAFYGRDFLHQATGGQIAGLSDENYSMFEAFSKQCTESRKWYTLWALNFDGSPYKVDYRNDNSFVREVPAQFEMVEKAYKQYLWSGDRRYIENEDLWNFYTNIMTKYVDLHDQNGNGVAQEVGTGIFSGSCTYNERGGRRVIEAGDAIGSQYQATLAYAGMLKARGENEAADEWYQKAADLKKYFNDEWSQADNMESSYVCAWGPDGERYSDFSKETSWFIPLKMITEPGENNDAYIDFILKNLGNGIGTTSTAPKNIEAYTYIPDMLFLYNRNEDAWKWMKYIASMKDKPHERPIQGTNGDYPEISFTFISHTIEGMLGVEPDAGEHFVATSPRLPKEVPDVTAKYMQIGNYELDLTHDSNTDSTLTNHGEEAITWEARFYGDHKYIQIDGQVVEAQQKEINGELVSYAAATVEAGEKVNAKVVSEEEYKIQEAKDAASKVDEKIDAIGEVTLDSKEAIEEARESYEELSDLAKEYVTKLDALEAAEKKLAELEKEAEEAEKIQEAKDAASKVDEKIDAIGEVTLDSKEAIEEARESYEELSDLAKEYVTKLDALEAAEKKLAELEKEAEDKEPPKEPSDSEEGKDNGDKNDSDNNNDNKDNQPNDAATGDSTPIGMVWMFMIVSLAAGMVLVRRKRR